MPMCPSCKTEQKARKNGNCPNCGVSIDIYKGYWYETSIGSPTLSILHHFEDMVSDVLSVGRPKRVAFTIPPKSLSYKRELVAAQRLLERADHDYALVIESLDILFKDRKFSWKTKYSLLWLEKEFVVALAIAKSDREIKELANSHDQLVLTELGAREDIFS